MKRIVVIAGTAAVAGVVGLGAAAAYADQTQTPAQTPGRAPSAPSGDAKGHVGIGLPGMPFPALPGALPGPIDQVLYGETVAKADDGSVKAFDWQNGQVTAVSGTSVTVRSSDGTTWTWTLTGDTRVRKNEKDASASAITTGDKVAVAGTRSEGTRTASRVVDPPPDPAKMRQRLQDLRKHLPRLRDDLRKGLPPSPPA